MSDTEAASTESIVKDEQLTVRAHIDPDKHWIGESLPSPSDQETTYAGIKTGSGTSPFPARANHSHDHRTTYGVYVSPGGGVTINPGQVFINDLSFYAGKNTLAPGSSQIVLFPIEGIWQVFWSYYADRNGGGNFVGEMNVVFYYNNGSYGRPITRVSTFDVPGSIWGFADDHVHYSYVDFSSNVQVAVQHNDAVAWTLRTQYFEVRRLHSFGSA